jgi:sulfide:quinone oxidoreductase
LPIYELALMAAHELADGPKIAVASFEPRPLDVFGRMASDALARLLHRAGIEFMPHVVPVEAADIALVTDDDRILGADAIISLPRLRGPAIEGLATDRHGFIDVDAHCRVPSVADVFAAGDVTSGRIKQGGLAAQQADAAAEMIAAEAGAPVSPRPCRHILRGVVLTGDEPLYLRRDLDDDTALARPLRDVPRGVSRDGLWSPNGKIAGRYLSAFLASRGLEETLADKRTGPDGPG